MKHLLASAVVCAALLPSTGFAGSVAVMVPDFPTISSPVSYTHLTLPPKA